MSAKVCFKCGQRKPLGEFYRHAAMADGHLNKCKACTKADAAARAHSSEAVRAYDRARDKTPERRAAKAERTRRMRREHPEKNRARLKVHRAVASGRLKRQGCEVCGAPAQAHHEDYSKPLDVRWLCQQHHSRAHRRHA